MSSFLFSIIIPTIRICNQNLTKLVSDIKKYTDNFEIIVIVDSSNCQNIREIYSSYKLDNMTSFCVEHSSKKGGPGLARNLGISKAKGFYISFMDDDDALTLKPELIDLLNSRKFDLIVGEFKHPNKDFERSFANNIAINRNTFAANLNISGLLINHCTGYFIALNIIRQCAIYFPTLMIVEDICFSACMLASVDSIFCTNFFQYHYSSTVNSTKNYNKIDSLFDIQEAICYTKRVKADKWFTDIYLDRVISTLDAIYKCRLPLLYCACSEKYLLPENNIGIICLLIKKALFHYSPSIWKRCFLMFASYLFLGINVKQFLKTLDLKAELFIFCDGVIARSFKKYLEGVHRLSIVGVIDDNEQGFGTSLSYRQFLSLFEQDNNLKCCIIIANISKTTTKRITDRLNYSFSNKTTSIQVYPISRLIMGPTEILSVN